MGMLLEVTELGLGPEAHPILSGVSLAVDEGEIHALLGANGAGKSSLAQALMGCADYLTATGVIHFTGRDITGLPMHERARLGIALAWQEPVRFEGITVADYLAIGGKAEPADCLRQVGLAPEDYLARPLDKTLSGGERKRIELAGVLALRPRLAILDEPTAGIDFFSQVEVEAVIRALRQQGAVLLITHQETLAAGADRASQLCGGRIVCTGTPADVIENFKARRCDGETCGLG